MNYRSTGVIFVVFVALLMFTACTKKEALRHSVTSSQIAVSAIKNNTEEALRQRVRTEWEARVSKELGTIYDMTVKHFQQKVTRDKFLQKPHINIKAFSIKEVEMRKPGQEATVKVDFTTDQMGIEFTFTKEEKWVWEDGAWCLNISSAKPMLPSGNKK